MRKTDCSQCTRSRTTCRSRRQKEARAHGGHALPLPPADFAADRGRGRARAGAAHPGLDELRHRRPRRHQVRLRPGRRGDDGRRLLRDRLPADARGEPAFGHRGAGGPGRPRGGPGGGGSLAGRAASVPRRGDGLVRVLLHQGRPVPGRPARDLRGRAGAPGQLHLPGPRAADRHPGGDGRGRRGGRRRIDLRVPAARVRRRDCLG